MTPKRQRLISIAEKYMQKAPTNLDAMANEMDVIVRYSAQLPSNVSAKLQNDERLGYVITVNANDNWLRQRFTLAHELSHLIYHSNLIGNGVTEDAMYRSFPWPCERIADISAVNMLMPAKLVKDAWNNGRTTSQALGKLFKVSAAAAQVRMKELNLH